ncbi:MAG: hypothetical protein CM15mP77_2850 [Synechococcus sp.]|nr:MAG: hypothetical protein CM15mP77_2850 [Synechococcus sp.]
MELGNSSGDKTAILKVLNQEPACSSICPHGPIAAIDPTHISTPSCPRPPPSPFCCLWMAFPGIPQLYAFQQGGEGAWPPKTGRPTSVTYGFLKALLDNSKTLKPEGVAIAF